MKRAIIVTVLLLAGVGLVGGWWWLNENPEWWFWIQGEVGRAVDELGLRPEPESPGLVSSGFIEASEVLVTTEMGGRVAALYANEGDEVAADQVLVELDDSLWLPQIGMAEAELAVAEATLAQAKADVQPETLEHAMALVSQAEAGQQVARVAWENAQAMVDEPQELNIAITGARAQLGVLDYQVQQAQALANSAQVGRNLADDVVVMLEDFEPFTLQIPVAPGVVIRKRIKLSSDLLPDAKYEQAIATYQSWEAWTGVDQALAAQTGAERYLAELARQRNNPLPLQVRANAAEAQYKVAGAAIALAQSQVDGLEIGATPEQIAAVEAQVEIARANRDALVVQLDKLTLRAPISGLVLERPIHAGEIAAPGAPLMSLADLDRVTMTVYVPEDKLGRVQIGQQVTVTVDAYPDRTFAGTVTFIATEAEFTPKNVQTREERVNMVSAVKVSLPNPDHALKPGMPADAMLSDEVASE